jgi:AcrR family transcriptional regulator
VFIIGGFACRRREAIERIGDLLPFTGAELSQSSFDCGAPMPRHPIDQCTPLRCKAHSDIAAIDTVFTSVQQPRLQEPLTDPAGVGGTHVQPVCHRLHVQRPTRGQHHQYPELGNRDYIIDRGDRSRGDADQCAARPHHRFDLFGGNFGGISTTASRRHAGIMPALIDPRKRLHGVPSVCPVHTKTEQTGLYGGYNGSALNRQGKMKMVDTQTPNARERILATAYELFTRRGIRDVGVDEVVERAGVAKATLYRHFPSKDELVLAFLEEREARWTIELVERRSRERAADPEGQILAILDVFDEWFRNYGDYEACSFIKVLFEMGTDGPIGQACIRHLDNIRQIVCERAQLAGLKDPKEFSCAFNILMKGSIVMAAEGDLDAAQRAKAMGVWLIDHYR